ncbi:MAG: hypothetical protein IT220_11010 [Flavobacteriaceae bacterium]|nr:hypothetical protein [Flavobacteriaceae bacterium]
MAKDIYKGKTFDIFILDKPFMFFNVDYEFNDFTDKEKIEIIENLLRLKGDQRILSRPVIGYNSEISQLYTGNEQKISIQVEALFLINQIYLGEDFKNYSPYPVILDMKNNETQTLQGAIIDSAYMSYMNWFQEVKRMGIKESKEKEIFPLDNSGLRWYK